MRVVINSATHRWVTVENNSTVNIGYIHQSVAAFGSPWVGCPQRHSSQRLLLLVHCATGNRNSNSGLPGNLGSNGNYWSSSPSSTTNGYNLNFNSGAVNPQNSNNRANGFSARCVAEFMV